MLKGGGAITVKKKNGPSLKKGKIQGWKSGDSPRGLQKKGNGFQKRVEGKRRQLQSKNRGFREVQKKGNASEVLKKKQSKGKGFSRKNTKKKPQKNPTTRGVLRITTPTLEKRKKEGMLWVVPQTRTKITEASAGNQTSKWNRLRDQRGPLEGRMPNEGWAQ